MVNVADRCAEPQNVANEGEPGRPGLWLAVTEEQWQLLYEVLEEHGGPAGFKGSLLMGMLAIGERRLGLIHLVPYITSAYWPVLDPEFAKRGLRVQVVDDVHVTTADEDPVAVLVPIDEKG